MHWLAFWELIRAAIIIIIGILSTQLVPGYWCPRVMSIPGTILSSSHSPFVSLGWKFPILASGDLLIRSLELSAIVILNCPQFWSLWPPWGHQRQDKWHQTVEPIVIPHSSYRHPHPESPVIYAATGTKVAVSGHRAGGNEQMASNEIFVFRPVLYIQAILDHGEAIQTWLKSKSDPITVTCGHKKGPALGKYCLLQATIATQC